MDWFFFMAAAVPLVFTPRLTFNCFGLPQTVALGLLSATGLLLGVAHGWVPIGAPSILSIIFLAYILLSGLWAFPPHNARKELGLQVPLQVFFLICLAYLTPRGMQVAAVAMTIAAGLVCLYANLQTHECDPFFNNAAKRGGAINRAIGTIGNPNFLAGYIAATFWLGWYAAASVEWGLLIIPVFMAYVLFKTGSRAGQFAIVGSTAFFLLTAAAYGHLPEKIANFEYDQKMFLHLTLSMGFLAGFFIVYLLKFNWETFWRKKIDPFGPQVWYATFRYRLCYILPALWMIAKKPIFGWGPRAYRREIYAFQAKVNDKYPDFLDPHRYITQQPRRVHNDYLEHVVEYGLFGSLIFFSIIGSVYYLGFSHLAGLEGKEFWLMLTLLSSVTSVLLDGVWFFPLRLATNSMPFYLSMAMVVRTSGIPMYHTESGWRYVLILVLLVACVGFLWHFQIKRWLASFFFIRFMEHQDGMAKSYFMWKCLKYAPRDSIYRTHSLIGTMGIDPVLANHHAAKLIEFFDGMTPYHQSLLNAALARTYDTHVLDEAEIFAKEAHYLQPHWDAPKKMLEQLSVSCIYKGGQSSMKQVNEGTQWKLKTLMQRKEVIQMQKAVLQKDIEKLETEEQLAEAVLQNALLMEKRRLNVPNDWTYNVEAGRFENPSSPPGGGSGIAQAAANKQSTQNV